MSNFYIKEEFTDGEMWAILAALDALVENVALTDEQYQLVESARNKILDNIE